MKEAEKTKLTTRNKETPPMTFRVKSRSLRSRFARAAAKDNRPIGHAMNQAMEEYCAKMGV